MIRCENMAQKMTLKKKPNKTTTQKQIKPKTVMLEKTKDISNTVDFSVNFSVI